LANLLTGADILNPSLENMSKTGPFDAFFRARAAVFGHGQPFAGGFP
jgi:hypothetical protein